MPTFDIADVATTGGAFGAAVGFRVSPRLVLMGEFDYGSSSRSAPVIEGDLVFLTDAHGRVDVSPKGDPPGFVHVIDDATIAIPAAAMTWVLVRATRPERWRVHLMVGVTFVVSAGNGGTDFSRTVPAAYPEVNVLTGPLRKAAKQSGVSLWQ